MVAELLMIVAGVLGLIAVVFTLNGEPSAALALWPFAFAAAALAAIVGRD